MSQDVLPVSAYLTYRLGEGESNTTFYRIHFHEDDAREVYAFFRDDVAAKHDRAEIMNRLIRGALDAEGFPTRIQLEGFTIQLGEEPSEGTDFPVGPEAYTWVRVRIRHPDGSKGYDWIREGADPDLRLLGEGELVGSRS